MVEIITVLCNISAIILNLLALRLLIQATKNLKRAQRAREKTSALIAKHLEYKHNTREKRVSLLKIHDDKGGPMR